jgi:hypothetical protein
MTTAAITSSSSPIAMSESPDDVKKLSRMPPIAEQSPLIV